jgi:lipoteichoic acid synthase
MTTCHDRVAPSRRWLPGLLLCLLPVLMLTAVWLHARTVEALAVWLMDLHGSFLLAAWRANLLSIGVFALLFGYALMVPQRVVGIVMALGAALLVCWMAADAFTTAAFWKRLELDDVLTFGGEQGAIRDVLVGQWGARRQRPELLLIAASVIALPVSLWAVWRFRRPPAYGRWHWVPVAVAGTCAVAALTRPTVHTVGEAALVSTIEFNWRHSRPPAYSASYLEQVHQRLDAPGQQSCLDGMNQRRNTILVIVESLSSIHSLKLGGVHDFLPHMDELAGKASVYERFIANGFRTDLGLISLINGRWPIRPPGGSASPYVAFYGLPDSLPQRMRTWGYHNAFYAGYDLGFIGQNAWLNALGFDVAKGTGENFAPLTGEGDFRGIADGDLYEAAAREIKNLPKPYMAVVNTISSHMPYINPVTREAGEEAAFRYVDSSFRAFIDRLEADGFFDDNGVLVMTSDHRMISPLSVAERTRFGESAFARVPMMVLGRNLPGVLRLPQGAYFQQVDIAPSLEYLNGAHACFRPTQRNLFDELPNRPACAFHLRGDSGRLANLFCDDAEATVWFGGDRTVIEGEVPTPRHWLDEFAASAVDLGRRRLEKSP